MITMRAPMRPRGGVRKFRLRRGRARSLRLPQAPRQLRAGKPSGYFHGPLAHWEDGY